MSRVLQSPSMPRDKRSVERDGRPEVALEIGAHKVACLIAVPDPIRGFRVLGLGRQANPTYNLPGRITPADKAVRLVSAAVQAAEQMAHMRVHRLIYTFHEPAMTCRMVDMETRLGGKVRSRDLTRMLETQRYQEGLGTRHMVHMPPTGFTVDELGPVTDPTGIYGEKLKAHGLVLSVPDSFVRFQEDCIERAHVGVVGLVPAAVASGYVVLSEDERQWGTTVVELGGGSSSFATFHHGQPLHTETLPAGGRDITAALANSLGLSFGDAEKLKVQAATIGVEGPDRDEFVEISVWREGHEQVLQFSKGQVCDILNPLVHGLLAEIAERIKQSGHLAGQHRFVFTGGVSQLQGLTEYASSYFDRPVRVGKPKRDLGLADVIGGPTFSSLAGLLAMQTNPSLRRSLGWEELWSGASTFSRISSWIRDSF